MDIALNFWISDPENGQGNVKSEVNLAVLAVLNAERVDIPFPQRVVRVIDSRPLPEEAASDARTAPSPPYRSTPAAS